MKVAVGLWLMFIVLVAVTAQLERASVVVSVTVLVPPVE